MSVIIPFDSESTEYELQVQLEEELFIFRVLYNSRDDSWSFDFRDADNVSILAGRKIVTDTDLFVSVPRTKARPLGILVFVDTAGDKIVPGRNDLGTRVKGYYFNSTEVLAF